MRDVPPFLRTAYRDTLFQFSRRPTLFASHRSTSATCHSFRSNSTTCHPFFLDPLATDTTHHPFHSIFTTCHPFRQEPVDLHDVRPFFVDRHDVPPFLKGIYSKKCRRKRVARRADRGKGWHVAQMGGSGYKRVARVTCQKGWHVIQMVGRKGQRVAR